MPTYLILPLHVCLSCLPLEHASRIHPCVLYDCLSAWLTISLKLLAICLLAPFASVSLLSVPLSVYVCLSVCLSNSTIVMLACVCRACCWAPSHVQVLVMSC